MRLLIKSSRIHVEILDRDVSAIKMVNDMCRVYVMLQNEITFKKRKEKKKRTAHIIGTTYNNILINPSLFALEFTLSTN